MAKQISTDIAQITHDSFQDFIGQVFEISSGAGRVSLILDNIKRFPGSMVRDARLVVEGVELPPRAAFALTFEGPREPIIDSGTYEISHPETGTMLLFLSPFRQDMDCMLYECVFN